MKDFDDDGSNSNANKNNVSVSVNKSDGQDGQVLIKKSSLLGRLGSLLWRSEDLKPEEQKPKEVLAKNDEQQLEIVNNVRSGEDNIKDSDNKNIIKDSDNKKEGDQPNLVTKNSSLSKIFGGIKNYFSTKSKKKDESIINNK